MLSLFSAGCTLIDNGARVLCTSVEDSVDDALERVRNRKWANEAWEQVTNSDPHQAFSADYAYGFKDGFAEYLFRGRDGEVPPLPPAKYRKFCYQTPEGYQAIEDWFAGYRHGVAVARDRGYRRYITGPVGFTLDEPADHAPGTAYGAAASLNPALPIAQDAPGQGPGAHLGNALPVNTSADEHEAAVSSGLGAGPAACDHK
jgi:hypothetical protein